MDSTTSFSDPFCQPGSQSDCLANRLAGKAPPLQAGKRAIAAPSWVRPGTIEENCRFLAGRVHEVGLLFYETASSLAYTATDLPATLAELPLTYHVHLPTDLPGNNGLHDAQICIALMSKVAHLNVQRVVLHPPPSSGQAARYFNDFARTWVDAGYRAENICLENIKANSLLELVPCIKNNNFSVCLDTGHAFAYDQNLVLQEKTLLDRTQLIHLNCTGKKSTHSGHQPLTLLNTQEKQACAALVQSVPPSAVIMLELFDWAMIEASLPLVNTWL